MTKSKPKNIILAIAILFFIAYSLYQARFLILGPRVYIDSHKDGAVVSRPVITIVGRARNVSRISLNGGKIFTDKKGYWEETLIVSPGISIMTITAGDRFGRETTKSIRIIFNG